LGNYDHLLHLAVNKKYINEEELQALQEWRVNPSIWGI
jgi:orotate phosphoribosyltransferase